MVVKLQRGYVKSLLWCMKGNTHRDYSVSVRTALINASVYEEPPACLAEVGSVRAAGRTYRGMTKPPWRTAVQKGSDYEENLITSKIFSFKK